jgi:hypothetical protein
VAVKIANNEEIARQIEENRVREERGFRGFADFESG